MKLTVVVSELADRDHLSVSIKTPSSKAGKAEDCSSILSDIGSEVSAMSDEEFLQFLMRQFELPVLKDVVTD